MTRFYFSTGTLWVCRVLAGLGTIIAFPTSTPAQVVADPSIGTVVAPNGTTFQITGGTTVGNRNLFHSFGQFDVPTGGVADFLNNPNIVNIFSRVTGGTSSQIDGIVRSSGTANLFLMNPSGIIFGQNAQLDVGGSFVATTANAIQFGDQGFFRASLSEPLSQLLTIDPSAFLFNQINVAPIQSNSRNLGVQEGKNLLLIGGDVVLNNSFLYVNYVEGGRVELGGLAAPGKIDLTTDGSIFYLGFPSNVLRANATLENSSKIDVTTGGGGSIAINARNVMLQNSQLLAGIDGGYGSIDSKAGNIDINALEAVVVEESSNIVNHIFSNNVGNSGDINIQAQKLIVRDSQVGASVFGSGNAGKIVVHAFDSVELSGEDPAQAGNRGYPGGLFAQVEPAGKGQGGSIIINTQRLSVSDGSKVQVASAPSKARLCQPGEETGTESLGQALGTECCVGSGNADGEAYTGR